MAMMMMIGLIAIASASSASAPTTRHGFVDRRAIIPPHATDAVDLGRRIDALQGAAAAQLNPRLTSDDGVFNPVRYGADPTCNASSSTAIDAAVKAMLSRASPSRKDPQGHFDLGGATLDLSGGCYLISKPVVFPNGHSNFRIERGTLVADPYFPLEAADVADGANFMLRIGNDTPCPNISGKDCTRNVDISQLTLDGSHRAHGLIIASHTVNVNIGPAVMATGWRAVGISLEGSGAGLIHHAWLGEVAPASPIPRTEVNGTAISLEDGQHDAMVDSVIIWSARVGIKSANGANRLQGVHAWNLMGADGGIGIELYANSAKGAAGGRVQSSYLDYAPLVIRSPGNTVVESNLFLGSSNIVLAATRPRTPVRGLIITGNVHHTHNSGNASILLDERNGNAFSSLEDVVVESNIVGAADEKAAGKRGTRATLSAPLAPGASTAHLWFGKYLLFNVSIDAASIRCALNGPHATGLSTTVPYPHEIVVHLEEAVPETLAQGTVIVTCDVDQSSRSCPAH